MRLTLLPFLLLLLSPASAQDLSDPEAEILPRVLDILCLDLIPERIGCETAVLVASETDVLAADLVLFSQTFEGNSRSKDVVVVARNLVSSSLGEPPWLERAGTSLKVQSEQFGVGRTPWTQTMTLAWRDGAVQVAGMTYTARDRLNTAFMSCDVNLLTGQWETIAGVGALDTPIERDRGQASPMTSPVTAWTVETPSPTVCEAVETRFVELSDLSVPE